MAKSSWGHIPAEILRLIFDYLEDKQHIGQCELVCKIWKEPAQRKFYTDIRLQSYDVLAQLLYSVQLNSSEEPGKFVKKLGLYHPWDQIHVFLETLAATFPALEQLNIANPSEEVYTRLRGQACTSHWQNLKKIPLPLYDDDIQHYVQSAIAYKNSLTHLHLVDKWCLDHILQAGDDTHYPEQFDLLAQHLSEFKHIKNIFVRKCCGEGIEYLDQIIDSCSELTYLIYEFFPLEVTIRRPSQLGSATIDLSEITPRPNIRKLDGSSLIHGDKSLLYIMHKFPGLEVIRWNNSFRSSYEDNGLIPLQYYSNAGYKYTPEVLAKFLLFADRLKINMLEKIYIDMPDEALALYFSKTVCRTINLTIEYDKPPVDDDTRETYAVLSQFNIRFSFGDRGPMASPKLAFYPIHSSVQHLKVVERAGKYVIGILHLDFKDKYTEATVQADSEIRSMLFGYFFDHAFYHCPKLARLWVSNATLLHCNPQQIINKKINDIRLEKCFVNMDILYHLSARLPALDTLTLDGCTAATSEGKEVISKQIMINMPFSAFENIEISGDSFISIAATDYSRLGFRISIQAKDMYYLLTRITKYRYAETIFDSDKYNELVDDPLCLVVHVKCKSIKKMNIFKMNDLYHTFDFEKESNKPLL